MLATAKESLDTAAAEVDRLPLVVDLDRGPEPGACGAEAELSPPLGDLDPFAAQP